MPPPPPKPPRPSPSADPTLFTSATPHASAKPTPPPSRAGGGRPSSTIDLNTTARPGETPQQKVARLREAARRAKMQQQSGWERVVARGRVWADRAHRVTALGILSFTVLAAGFTVFAVGDMLLYNRRRRHEFMRLAREHRETSLAAANEALAQGQATPEQVALLKDEEDRMDEVRRKAEKSFARRLREGLVGGWQKEDIRGGTMGVQLGRSNPQPERAGEEQGQGVVRAVENMVSEAKEMVRRETPGLPVAGGPLDQHAAKAAQDVEKASRSWWQWATRR